MGHSRAAKGGLYEETTVLQGPRSQNIPLELEVLLAAGSLAVSRHKKAPAAGDRGKKCGMREL
jgi:hypothetical protein